MYPRVAKLVPTTSLFKASTGMLVLVFGCTPYLAGAGPLLMPLLLLQNLLNKAFTSTGFTAVFVIINNSCPSSHRGRVNGLAMTIASGFKAAAPMLGAVLFAWSLTNGIHMPLLDVHFAFLTCGLSSLLVLAVARRNFTPANDRPLPDAGSSAEMARPSEAMEASARPAAAVAEAGTAPAAQLQHQLQKPAGSRWRAKPTSATSARSYSSL